MGSEMCIRDSTNTMLPAMSVALLERQMNGEQVIGIDVGVANEGFTYEFQKKLPDALPKLAPGSLEGASSADSLPTLDGSA